KQSLAHSYFIKKISLQVMLFLSASRQGVMVPHFSRDGHLTDEKFSGVIQTRFGPGLAKRAFLRLFRFA
ncbi:hypothetical protein, partial [Escherichia coli]|uniref:hypothetical protein n=1 Tax=Escherichia coli TaxID=562 RepID=UPI001BD2CD9F